jgi:hypothetical protein
MVTELVEVLKRGLRVDVGILNPLFAINLLWKKPKNNLDFSNILLEFKIYTL